MFLLNILIVVFILAMGYWWWLQGLFSSFLHLLAVIIAGAMSFAVWEIVAQMLLNMGELGAQFAWFAGLLLPFGIILIIIRVATDKIVRGNLQILHLVSSIGGAVLGVLAAALTAGIFVIALGFSPAARDMAGFQPYSVAVIDQGSTGAKIMQVSEEERQVLFGLDRVAAGFFSRLSNGALQPITHNQTLAARYPDLSRLAGYWRLHPDENSLRVATSDSVNLVSEYDVVDAEAFAAAVGSEVRGALPRAATQAGGQVVLVGTAWNKTEGVYDNDDVLRLAPLSMILLTRSTSDEIEIHLPLGWTQDAPGGRSFFPLSDTGVAEGRTGNDVISWVYAIAPNQTPIAMRARGLYLPLPGEPDEDPAELASTQFIALGTYEEQNRDRPDGAFDLLAEQTYELSGRVENFNSSTAARAFTRTSNLPSAVSVNKVTSGTYDWDDEDTLLSGNFVVEDTGGRGQRTLIRRININEDAFVPVRVTVAASNLRNSVLGQAQQLANMLNPPRLGYNTRTGGETRYADAVAYVLQTDDSGLRIYFDNDIQSNLMRAMREYAGESGAVFHLYFRVPFNAYITEYRLGEASQSCNVWVPSEASLENQSGGGQDGGNNSGGELRDVPDPTTAPGAGIGL